MTSAVLLLLPSHPIMLPGRLLPALRRGLATQASQQAPPTLACLEGSRGVIRIAGAGLVHFLQGIVTADVLPLEAPGAAPQYACMLNAQGRHLHDLLLYRTADAEPTVLADVDAAGMEDLLRLLKRYRLRQKLDIQDVSQQYRVWARWGGAAGEGSAAGDSGATAPPGWAPDPRLPQLGLRAVLPRGGEGDGAGGSCGWEAHRRWRMLNGVAEGDSEIPSGEVIPLEFNLDGLNGISFTKGCYVGQELMARTHFKGVVRKRLMPFFAAPADSPPVSDPQAAAAEAVAAAGASSSGDSSSASQPGAAVYVEQEGGKRKSLGVVRVADGPLGMAVLRLAAAQAAQAAGQPLLVGEGDAVQQLFPWRPDWWPRSWGHEEEDGAAGADS